LRAGSVGRLVTSFGNYLDKGKAFSSRNCSVVETRKKMRLTIDEFEFSRRNGTSDGTIIEDCRRKLLKKIGRV
jgi:hypothetical protein